MAAALVLAVGGWRVMEGHLSIGVLIGFQALMAAFLEPVSRVLELSSELQTLRGDLDRLDDVLSQQTEPQPEPKPELTELSGRVSLDGLTFGYATILDPLVADLSVEIPPGSQVAPGERFPFGEGWLLDADAASMDSLLIVASSQPLPWIEGLDVATCADMVGKPFPASPSTDCEHLYGLFGKVPPMPRGKGVGELPELMRKPGVVAVMAVPAEHRGNGLVAVQYQFKSR